jgi:hypothetical protein
MIFHVFVLNIVNQCFKSKIIYYLCKIFCLIFIDTLFVNLMKKIYEKTEIWKCF